MKKNDDENQVNEMRSEYDFSGGVRGKHHRHYRKGHIQRVTKKGGTIIEHFFTAQEGSIMLDPDVKKHFPDSESVNRALREYMATH